MPGPSDSRSRAGSGSSGGSARGGSSKGRSSKGAGPKRPSRAAPPARGKVGAPKRSGPGGPKRGGVASQDDGRSVDLRRKGWGSLARKGAARIAPRDDISDTASIAWRKAVQEARDQDLGTDFEPEVWVEVDDVRAEATGAVRRGQRPARDPGAPGPMDDQRAELAKSVGAPQAEKLDKVLKEAARAFQRERFGDTRRLLVPVADRVPGSAPVRELLGLSYYRMGRWKQAVRELEAFRELSGSTEQHPVLADCYRALSRWRQVDELWEELREASPSAELVTEGRIVTAGALADRGKLREAISLLGAQRWTLPKGPRDHHLRRAYALADLHERAGDLPRARELFGRVQRADAGFADVGDRLRALN